MWLRVCQKFLLFPFTEFSLFLEWSERVQAKLYAQKTLPPFTFSTLKFKHLLALFHTNISDIFSFFSRCNLFCISILLHKFSSLFSLALPSPLPLLQQFTYNRVSYRKTCSFIIPLAQFASFSSDLKTCFSQ